MTLDPSGQVTNFTRVEQKLIAGLPSSVIKNKSWSTIDHFVISGRDIASHQETLQNLSEDIRVTSREIQTDISYLPPGCFKSLPENVFKEVILNHHDLEKKLEVVEASKIFPNPKGTGYREMLMLTDSPRCPSHVEKFRYSTPWVQPKTYGQVLGKWLK
jgi:hypothetical protein